MWMQTTSPRVIQELIGSPAVLVSGIIWVSLHSRATGLAATRSGLTRREGAAASLARSNSSTPWGKGALVSFISGARSRVARFQTNSPVSWMLRTLSFQPFEEKPTIGGL